MTVKESHAGTKLKEAKACATPWIKGVEKVSQRVPDNTELKTHLKVLRNASYAKLVDVPHAPFAIEHLSEVPEKITSVVIVAHCSRDALWNKTFANRGFVASFHGDSRAVTLDSTVRLPELVQGLVLAHEMRHLLQHFNGQTSSPQNKAVRHLNELEAYEFQFLLLDRLHLPGYRDILHQEMERLKSEHSQKQAATMSIGKHLDKLFPDLGMHLDARKVVGTMLFLRAHFKIYEESDLFSSRDMKLKFMSMIHP